MKLFLLHILFASMLLVFDEKTNAQNVPCNQTEKNYLSNGQKYFLIAKHSGESYLDILFYPGIDYKIKNCPENENAIIEMSIFDKNSTLLFTNADKNYVNQWNFRFQALMNARIKLKIQQSSNKEEPVSLLISYRIKKKETENK